MSEERVGEVLGGRRGLGKGTIGIARQIDVVCGCGVLVHGCVCVF